MWMEVPWTAPVLEPKEIVSSDELLMSQVVSQEAVCRTYQKLTARLESDKKSQGMIFSFC